MSSLGSDSEYVTTSDEPVNTDILAENPPTTNEPEAVDQMGFENVEVVDQQAGDGLDNLATFDKPVTLDNAEPVPVDVDNVELNEVDLLGVNWTINRVQELRRNTATFQKEVVPAVGMSVPFSNTKLRVPKGFQNILEGLAREVLRSQPGNIYEFGANYFEHMLKIRDEEGIDPAKHGAQMEDRFYNNKAFKEPDVDPADPQQQDAAKAIQTKYRQHQAKQLVEGLREEQAAVRIQAGYRGFKDRERVLEMRDPDEYNRRVAVREARIAARGMRPTDSALAAVSGDAEEEVDIDLTDPDVEQAAIKIQAGFKGFKARQEVQKMKVDSSEPVAISDPTVNDEEEVDIDLNDPEVEKATIKIQAGFKGMQARKAVKERREELAHQGESDTQASEGTVQEAPLEEVNAAADETPSAEESKPAEETKPVEETKSEQAKPEEPKEEEEIDIDLNDPKVADATVKIQAGFKGMKARKEVKEKRSLIESQKSGTGPSEVAGEGEGSTDKVAEETEPTTTQSTEEAEPTTTQSTEEAEPTTTQSTEQVEPTTTQSTEEAKPTTEKPEEEAEPTAENTTEEAEPTEEKPQGDEQS